HSRSVDSRVVRPDGDHHGDASTGRQAGLQLRDHVLAIVRPRAFPNAWVRVRRQPRRLPEMDGGTDAGAQGGQLTTREDAGAPGAPAGWAAVLHPPQRPAGPAPTPAGTPGPSQIPRSVEPVRSAIPRTGLLRAPRTEDSGFRPVVRSRSCARRRAAS